ncbi:MAG TPA: hypothetical protein VFS30_17430 [Dehalococcoidia bacterium]|nr:hypothetical protein [Dehalococcoidia bacterium]
MKRISRRSLLIATGAGLPAAAIVALTRPWEDGNAAATANGSSGLVMPQAPTSSPPPRDDERVRTVRSGDVVAIDGDTITIENHDGARISLTVSDFMVDEGFWVDSLPIELGDHVIANAGNLWVNPKFYYGSILEVIDAGPEPPVRFRMRDRYDLSPYHEQQPEGHFVLIDPRTLISGPLPDPAPSVTPYEVPEDAAANRGVELKVGQRVEVVGREHQGELYAIRLML